MSTPAIEDEVATSDKKPAAQHSAPRRPRRAPAPAKKKKKLHPLIDRYKKPAMIVAGIDRAHRRASSI